MLHRLPEYAHQQAEPALPADLAARILRGEAATELVADAGESAAAAVLRPLNALRKCDWSAESTDDFQPMIGELVRAVTAGGAADPGAGAQAWWVAGCDSREADRFVGHPDDRSPEADRRGRLLAARPGERSRLIAYSAPAEDAFALHLLARPAASSAGNPAISLRLFEGAERERTVLRLRPSSVVLGGEVEVELPLEGVIRLFSIAVLDGVLRIWIDGLPAYARRYPASVPTGFVLDVSGGSAGEAQVLLPATVLAGRLDERWVRGEAAIALASERMRDALADSDRGAIARLLHAMAEQPLDLARGEIKEAIQANLCAEKAFAEHVHLALSARLADRRTAAVLPEIAEGPQPVIRIEDVTVEMSRDPAGDARLMQLLLKRGVEKLKILDGVNLNAFAGDIVGVLGKNGAGKSTLLRTMIGAMPISRGRIWTAGRPILLRPGAGMQGDLTGRQNVYRAGLYMGLLPAEIRGLLDEVVAFAELEEHIDRPFRYYSDGMRSRLVFALATAVPREILMLDELLSAGDIGFQQKAAERLEWYIEQAKVVLVVQHTLDFIQRRCTKCLVLNAGRQLFYGDPKIAAEIYQELF